MCNLIHDKVGVFEEAQYAIVELDGDIITILFHAEGAEDKVLHPVVVELFDDSGQVLGLDDLTNLYPGRPQEGELV